MKSKGVERRFWEKVLIGGEDECWLWNAAKTPAGYGVIGVGLRTVLAHRLSYEINNGTIPEGLHVLHSCDTPSCVNPCHLRCGTDQDNRNDAVARNRQPKGERHWNAKLTYGDAEKIRDMVENGAMQKDVADRYGVSRSTICEVVKGLRF